MISSGDDYDSSDLKESNDEAQGQELGLGLGLQLDHSVSTWWQWVERTVEGFMDIDVSDDVWRYAA